MDNFWQQNFSVMIMVAAGLFGLLMLLSMFNLFIVIGRLLRRVFRRRVPEAALVEPPAGTGATNVPPLFPRE